MSITAIAIIFGIVYPVYCYLANCFNGNACEAVQTAKKEYISSHPILALIGIVMSALVPLAYWIAVIIFLV